MPKISVIIPIYNVEKYLKRCLDSVIEQTFSDFEIICVNDGSPDGCASILSDFKMRDKRIKIINQENQGISIARNNGLKKATGDYIYFLDSDDAMHPQLLEIAYRLIQKYNADLVNFECFNENKEKFELKKINFKNLQVKVTNNPVLLGSRKEKYRIHFNVWTKLYKKELLKGTEFIPNIHFEDYPHTFAILAKKPRTVVTTEKLYFYSANENSISNKKGNPKQIRDYHIGMNTIFKIYSKPELQKELKFLKRKLIPNLLKQQLGRCQRSDEKNKSLMFAEFTKELIDLDNQGLISWRGHKLTRYLKYRKLIKEAKNEKN